MKLPRTTKGYASICVCLLFSYAFLISTIAPLVPRTAYASSGHQHKVESAALKDFSDKSPANVLSTLSFAQSSSEAKSRVGEVLVRFRANASEQDKNSVAAAHGAQRKKLRGDSGIEKLTGLTGQSAESLALSLLQQPAVEFAEPNFLIQPDQASGVVPNDEQFVNQWALRNTGQEGGQFGSDINVANAWQIGTGAQSTVIAVIDSGIDFNHPDLENNQWTNPSPGDDGDLHGWDYVTDTGIIKDEQGHGTAVAGIIAAQGNNGTGISGVMWRAGLMSLRVLDNTGTGDVADAVEAIDYAAAHGAQIINISWGTNGESIALEEALERALRRGVVVVCSAGNGSQDLDTAPYYPASFGLRDLIIVAATDNFDQLVTWSNWGAKNVTVAAPGANILTTKMGGGYWRVNGTSASAPLVAGLAGLIKTAQPGLRPNQVSRTLSEEARQVVSLGGKVAAGGVANAADSLASLQGSSRPDTLPTPGYGSGGTGPGGTFSTTPPPRTTEAPASTLPNLDERRTTAPEQPSARQPIQSNLMCADCDPQSGGGGGSYHPANDPNFSTARMRPANETGEPGVDLGSRNFNWGLPLVSLRGRAGMDLNLALSYNSLVWTKDGSYIKYNGDLGSPAPGFRIGLPILQQRFLDAQTGGFAYLMVTSAGARVKMRQVGTSNIYESQDGNYTQLDATNPNAHIVRTTDGTQLKFVPAPINGEFRCTQIKDRNGNFISATFHPTNGHLLAVTDTLGRVITFVYDASSNLQAIRQTWSGVAHDWATFEYGQVYVAPAFGGGLLVNGPNNSYVTVLTRVNLHDGTYFTFNYNAAFGQVNRINHYAADGHLLEYTSYNVDSSAGQTDCPRFTQRRDWAENWNNGAEALTSYSAAADNSWSQQTAPDGTTIHKQFFATTGWQTGLTTLTETWSGGVKKKWTTISWTQDDTNLAYPKNPRVTEANVYDVEGNRKRVTIDYGPYAQWSLPNMVREYAADGITEVRHNYIDYNLSQAYLDRRIIGLVSARHMSDTLTWHSIVYYAYDAAGSQLVATPATTLQHDVAYNTSFAVGRGNLTSITRYDVHDINNASKRAVTQMGYDTNGSVVFTKDALNHQTSVSYADSFSDGVNRNTFAYPTTVTDPDNYSSTAQYKFDFGAVTRTQDPKGAVFTTTYDAAGRTDKITSQFNGAYTRYVYSAYGDIASFSTIQNGAGEAFSITYFDGAGRLRSSGGDLPGSTGLYRGQFWLYDNMGRLSQQTNPAEMNGNWAPVGEDAAGWVWSYQTYDWQGRPLLTTNPDGTTRENTYGGCGCAGGEVTTVRDERGRRRKLTKDVLGRLKQVDELNWNQTVYATTSYSYNGRDQILQSNQAGQLRTFVYDGHGRLSSRTTPEQGTASYGYYQDDTVQTMTDARGAKTNLSYNNRHLVTHISHDTTQAPGVATTNQSAFSYDAAGNRTNMTTWYLGTVNYQYDTLSRMTSETRYFDNVGSFTLNYEYNLAGEVTKITNPWNAEVSYGYDKVGRPISIAGANYASGTDYVNSIGYRVFGVKQMANANGRTLSLQYDNRMRVTRWDVPGVMGWSYAYATPLIQENTGRVAFADNLYDATLDRSYDYDHVGRMWASHTGKEGRGHAGYEAWGPPDGPYAENYSYDQFGNMTWRNGWGVVNAQYAYNPQFANNRIMVNPVTGAGMTYDAAGNLTNDGSQSFTYDATGQQTYASATGLTQSYDGDRLRAKKVESGTTTYYLRSSVLGGQVIAELNASGGWTRGYVYLGGQMVALQGGTGGQISWVHQDPVTKSQRVTNSAGTVISTIDLDPWGGETGRSSNQAFQPHRYTSYTRDGNGGDDAMMRRYQVNWSRFAQPDPYDGAYDMTDPQSFNRYAYVQNDPVNFVDPSGLMRSICVLDITELRPSVDCFGGNRWGGYDPKDPSEPGNPGNPPQNPAPGSFEACVGGLGGTGFTKDAADLINKISGEEGTSRDLLAVTWMNESGFDPRPGPNKNGQLGDINAWDVGPFHINIGYTLGAVSPKGVNFKGLTVEGVFGYTFYRSDGKTPTGTFDGVPLENGRMAARRLNFLGSNDRDRAVNYAGRKNGPARGRSYDANHGAFVNFFNCYKGR